jgi:hypothetical protein
VYLTVISGYNFRFDDTFRARAPRWTGQITQATARCRADPGLAYVVVRGGPQPYWSIVLVPCAELRKKIDCPTPACVFLDPPRAQPATPSAAGGTGRVRRDGTVHSPEPPDDSYGRHPARTLPANTSSRVTRAYLPPTGRLPSAASVPSVGAVSVRPGQSTMTANTDDAGTGPAHRESLDWARLSPMTKTESAGTVTAANRRGPQ